MNILENVTGDPLDIIEDEARNVAVCYGAQWCEEAATMLKRRIVIRLGGAQIYVPRLSATQRQTRDERIRAMFSGRNIRELANEFQTSERTIRRILGTIRKT